MRGILWQLYIWKNLRSPELYSSILLEIIVTIWKAASPYIYVIMEMKIACNMVWKSFKEIFELSSGFICTFKDLSL